MPFVDDQNPLWTYDPSNVASTRRPGFNIGAMGAPRGAMLIFDPGQFTSKTDLLTKFRAMKAAILADPNALLAERGQFRHIDAPVGIR